MAQVWHACNCKLINAGLLLENRKPIVDHILTHEFGATVISMVSAISDCHSLPLPHAPQYYLFCTLYSPELISRIVVALSSHSTTQTPTSSPTSSRGSSRECLRVVQLAT